MLIVLEASVVVAEFDLIRVAVHEAEADAPVPKTLDHGMYRVT
jgi:hypothetical protein